MQQGFTVTSGAIATTTAAKTILAVNSAAAVEVNVTAIIISTDGTSGTTQMLWEVTRLTTAGTSTATPPTPVPRSVRSTQANAVTVGATIGHNYTAEPTASVLYAGFMVPTMGVPLILQFPLGREPMAVGAAHGIGVRLTGATGSIPNARVTIEWEE